jgi:hypothetical protein
MFYELLEGLAKIILMNFTMLALINFILAFTCGALLLVVSLSSELSGLHLRIYNFFGLLGLIWGFYSLFFLLVVFFVTGSFMYNFFGFILILIHTIGGALIFHKTDPYRVAS